MHACMHVCMNVCMHVCMYVCMCIYVCMYLYMYVCLFLIVNVKVFNSTWNVNLIYFPREMWKGVFFLCESWSGTPPPPLYTWSVILHFSHQLPTDVSNRYDKVVWVHSLGGGLIPSEWWLVGVDRTCPYMSWHIIVSCRAPIIPNVSCKWPRCLTPVIGICTTHYNILWWL